jgi:hypothetical protein
MAICREYLFEARSVFRLHEDKFDKFIVVFGIGEQTIQWASGHIRSHSAHFINQTFP